jgi:hypothetical protein
MEILQPPPLTTMMNGMLIALVISVPLLLGLSRFSGLCRVLKAGRRIFEQDIIEKPEPIQRDLTRRQKHLLSRMDG